MAFRSHCEPPDLGIWQDIGNHQNAQIDFRARLAILAQRLDGRSDRLPPTPGGAPGVYSISFNDTGTGWQESFLLAVPRNPLPSPPLLVMFHGYSTSENSCLTQTPLMKMAMERGWYVVAPLGAHQMNYGVPYSQANIEFVLDWVLHTLPIDTDRIYGIGFSMGGGGVSSYAARHLDPDHARFAARGGLLARRALRHRRSRRASPSRSARRAGSDDRQGRSGKSCREGRARAL